MCHIFSRLFLYHKFILTRQKSGLLFDNCVEIHLTLYYQVCLNNQYHKVIYKCVGDARVVVLQIEYLLYYSFYRFKFYFFYFHKSLLSILTGAFGTKLTSFRFYYFFLSLILKVKFPKSPTTKPVLTFFQVLHPYYVHKQ